MLLHIPSEAATFGVKFWVLAERNTGHVAHLEWYIGKKFTLPFNRLQGPKAVLHLLKTAILLHKGYYIVCDNYFCSFDLARKLPMTFSI